jgi:hypothetical protein
MDDNRSPAELILDLIVFGPAGLALTAVEEFPKLVDKGRNHLEGQVRTARLVGQVAIQMGRRQLDQMVGQRTSKSAPPAPDQRPVDPVTPAVPAPPSTAPRPEPEAKETAGAVAGANGKGSHRPLAIPGYDSLSASQVVQRLAGLSPSELVDVRAHEQSHRHRRTILNRVEQLLTGVDAE